MLARYMLSSCVCLSVRSSVTSMFYTKTVQPQSRKQRLTIAHFYVAEDLGEISTGLPLTGLPNTGEVGYNQGRRSLWDNGTCPPIFMNGDIHGNVPQYLDVMSFRMSTRVIATVVCCILMQILCVVSQKASASGGLRPPDPLGDFVPQTLYLDPAGGLPSPRPPVFFYVPPIIL